MRVESVAACVRSFRLKAFSRIINSESPTSTTTCGSLSSGSWCNSNEDGSIILGTVSSASACLALCESYDLSGTTFQSGCCQWCSGAAGCDGSGIYAYNVCLLMPNATDTTWGDSNKYYSTDDCTAADSTTAASDVADSGFEGAGITATPVNGAECSGDGIVLDGTNDYVNITTWQFGGEPMTVEVYAYLNGRSSTGWERSSKAKWPRCMHRHG